MASGWRSLDGCCKWSAWSVFLVTGADRLINLHWFSIINVINTSLWFRIHALVVCYEVSSNDANISVIVPNNPLLEIRETMASGRRSLHGHDGRLPGPPSESIDRICFS